MLGFHLKRMGKIPLLKQINVGLTVLEDFSTYQFISPWVVILGAPPGMQDHLAIAVHRYISLRTYALKYFLWSARFRKMYLTLYLLTFNCYCCNRTTCYWVKLQYLFS